MRALLLFSSSELGGAERSLCRMVFASKKINWQLATLSGEGPWCNWVRSVGFEPIVLGRTSVNTGLMLPSFFRLFLYLRSSDINLIYVCGFRASLVLRFFKIFYPSINIVHGVRWNPDSNNLRDRIFRLSERLTYPLVDAWITNSDIARQTLIKNCGLPALKVHKVYNGLDINFKKIVPIQQRPFNILTIANLNIVKGHLEYLNVIKEVVKIFPAARFIFIGRDDMRGEVQQAIKNLGLAYYVKYEGFREDVSPWLLEARIFVLPSHNEGCPTVLLEAMSFGIPCIAFKVGGVPELFANKEHGILLEKGDYAGLVAAIIYLLNNDDEASQQAIMGQKHVITNFDIKNSEFGHFTIFADILAKKNF